MSRFLSVFFYVCWCIIISSVSVNGAEETLIYQTITATQPKMVKIHGAGGFQGMEPYQSGFLISAEGHILTVFSYVLDTDDIQCVLNDGSHYTAKLVGADPYLDVAVLKIDHKCREYVNLSSFQDVKSEKVTPESVSGEVGERILAFSNLYAVAVGNEPVTVQHGVISSVVRLDARRGAYQSNYRGPVYILDAITNNPGAQGGLLVTRSGEPVGLLGKELRHVQTGMWLNYALPLESISVTVNSIINGTFRAQETEKMGEKKPEHSVQLVELGLRLVPDVVYRTPPYVDRVTPGSRAEKAGLRPDDLILYVGDELVQSCQELKERLSWIDYQDPVRILISRNGEIMDIEIKE